MENAQLQELTEKLSPLERRIVPHLGQPYEKIKDLTGLDDTSLLHALRFLESKGVLKLSIQHQKIIELGTNGIYYKKHQLPERRLLILLEEQGNLSIEEVRKLSKLSENELKASIGVLKSKALVALASGRMMLQASREELMKKSLEEQLLEKVPCALETLPPELLHAFENLRKRKEIIELVEQKSVTIELTETGRALAGTPLDLGLVEEVTPEVIQNWSRKRKFRKYELHSPLAKISGGKRHFVNQAIDYGKRIWLDLGFQEMTGTLAVSSFWNFDALFTAQDHPVREIHDTFFIKDVQANLPKKSLVEQVKKAHEHGVSGSKGWRYLWNEKTAQRVLIRTHTTCLSAQTLARLKKEDLPAKYFAIGKCFRNETTDWKHGFEFNQTEGIVVDPEANFRHLLGYLKEFAKKMGFENVRFQPSYFPYTEPSVEGLVWNEERKEWTEVLAAGIFRPEVTVPLLGAPIPVLAWGPGFDRLMMMAYDIKDMRQLYANDIQMLREMPLWKR